MEIDVARRVFTSERVTDTRVDSVPNLEVLTERIEVPDIREKRDAIEAELDR